MPSTCKYRHKPHVRLLGAGARELWIVSPHTSACQHAPLDTSACQPCAHVMLSSCCVLLLVDSNYSDDLEAVDAAARACPAASFLPAWRGHAVRPPRHSTPLCIACGRLFRGGRAVDTPCRHEGVSAASNCTACAQPARQCSSMRQSSQRCMPSANHGRKRVALASLRASSSAWPSSAAASWSLPPSS